MWKGGSPGQSFIGVCVCVCVCVWDGLRVGSVLYMFMQWKFVVYITIYLRQGGSEGVSLRSFVIRNWMNQRTTGQNNRQEQRRFARNLKKGNGGKSRFVVIHSCSGSAMWCSYRIGKKEIKGRTSEIGELGS